MYALFDRPPANMAKPWLGNDVAARLSLATPLRASVVQAAGHSAGCAAAKLMMHMESNSAATAKAAVSWRLVEEPGRVSKWIISLRDGGCACWVARNALGPRMAWFL